MINEKYKALIHQFGNLTRLEGLAIQKLQHAVGINSSSDQVLLASEELREIRSNKTRIFSELVKYGHGATRQESESGMQAN